MILGLSAGYHDAAAALLVDGHIVAAVEEERLTRVKHDASFPARAIDTCLAIAELAPADVDAVAFHEKPVSVFGRQLASRLRAGPTGLGEFISRTPTIASKQLGTGRRIQRWFSDRDAAPPPITFAEHHISHAAAAFYPSPFESAAIITIDGVGEWATSSLGHGQGHRIHLDRELRYPNSIGLLYAAFTTYCGFRANGGEGELMGLAPFGEPRFADDIREHLVHLADDGSVDLDQRYFAHLKGRRATSGRFHDLFGGPPRAIGEAPTQREADLAASIQVVTEEIVLAMAAEAHRETGADSVCIAGGVALNCVANGRVVRDGPFDHVWVQPAASDAGNAVGAACWLWHQVLGEPRTPEGGDGMAGAFLGPSFADDEVRAWLAAEGIAATEIADDAALAEAVAARLADGAVVGWFQGRMEFGPRALGHRSILADARSATVQARINAMIKERAAFRPFAPAVLADRAGEWFAHPGTSPYMSYAAPVSDQQLVPATDGTPPTSFEEHVARVRSTIPAVTHVDGSARFQTVDAARNPEFAALLEAFERATGCPVLLNTSFNGADEPIVCTPADAHRTFEATGLDLLVLGPFLVERS